MEEIWWSAGFNKYMGYNGIKGYCGHITHLRHILRLWYFDILFVYLFSCLFVPRVVLILQEKNGPIFPKKIHCQHQQGLGSQKYFWCLVRPGRFLNSSPKLFPLNFVCYFSLSVKKMPSVMNKAPTDNELSLQPSYQGNRRHSWSWVWILIIGNGKYKHV